MLPKPGDQAPSKLSIATVIALGGFVLTAGTYIVKTLNWFSEQEHRIEAAEKQLAKIEGGLSQLVTVTADRSLQLGRLEERLTGVQEDIRNMINWRMQRTGNRGLEQQPATHGGR